MEVSLKRLHTGPTRGTGDQRAGGEAGPARPGERAAVAPAADVRRDGRRPPGGHGEAARDDPAAPPAEQDRRRRRRRRLPPRQAAGDLGGGFEDADEKQGAAIAQLPPLRDTDDGDLSESLVTARLISATDDGETRKWDR